jgi:hypothetical protein
VAALFRVTPETFRNKRAELEAKGFPHRLPASTLWSRPAVDHWFRTSGNTYAPLMPPRPDAVTVEVNAAREALEGRYAS